MCWEPAAHRSSLRDGWGREVRSELGLVGRGAGRRAPHAGRAVMLTAVQSLRLLVRRGAGTEGAGRRIPCAGRAVMLTAVQSLRRACSEGGTRTGFCVIVLGTGGAASGSRDPRLLTGRPYGTGRVRRGGGGTEVPQGNDCRGVGAGVWEGYVRLEFSEYSAPSISFRAGGSCCWSPVGGAE